MTDFIVVDGPLSVDELMDILCPTEESLGGYLVKKGQKAAAYGSKKAAEAGKKAAKYAAEKSEQAAKKAIDATAEKAQKVVQHAASEASKSIEKAAKSATESASKTISKATGVSKEVVAPATGLPAGYRVASRAKTSVGTNAVLVVDAPRDENWPTTFIHLASVHASGEESAKFFDSNARVNHCLPMMPLMGLTCGADVRSEAIQILSLEGPVRDDRLFEIEKVIVLQTMQHLDAQQTQIATDLQRGKFSMRTELLDQRKLAAPTGMQAQ